jgi:uncharacterized protein
VESSALFHLAFAVTDLNIARQFYGNLLGCAQGRSTESWIDFNFYGHQIVAHLVTNPGNSEAKNKVDGDDVPIPHFGAILPMENWQALADKLSAAGIKFIVEPHLRFKGQIGEQATMFFSDPFGNTLEFKSFRDASQIFAS